MAIDYNRKRPEPAKPEPSPAAPSGLPSWYTPPEEEETAAAPVPPSAPTPPSAPAPPPPAAYPPPPSAAYPAPAPAYPPPPAAWPPPGAAAPPSYPPPYQQPPAYPPAAQPPAYQPPAQQPSPAQQPPAYPPAAQPPAYQRTSSLPAPGQGAISLQKVTLTAASPQVSLTKSGGSSGTIRINLNWSSGVNPAAASAQKGGFFKRLAAQAQSSSGVDLDLGCLYELSDGSKGVVQALGNSFGSLDRPPWIKLDGDDRTGSVTTGENMSINLEQPGRFRRVLIFAMIYEGAANWAAVDGVVTLSPINGPQIEVRLDATDQASRICAVAQLINHGNDLVVQREVQYINGGQSVLDRAYNWGMNWTPGRK